MPSGARCIRPPTRRSFSLSAPLDLENFARAWKQAPFARYYLNTIVLVTLVLVGQLILSTLAAYALRASSSGAAGSPSRWFCCS